MIRFTKRLVLLVLALVAFSSAAFAQTYVYSYRTNGVWDEFASWTTVSGGLQYQNTAKLTPKAGDNVTISTGKKMTYSGSADAAASVKKLTVDGTLVIASGKIVVEELAGKGEVVLSDLNQLIVGDPNTVDMLRSFQGTVTLVSDYLLNATGSSDYSFGALKVQSGTVTIKGEISVPGNVEIDGGSLVLSDVSQNVLTVGGDLIVSKGARLSANGSRENIVNVYGNVDNEGIIGGAYFEVDESQIHVTPPTNAELMSMVTTQAPAARTVVLRDDRAENSVTFSNNALLKDMRSATQVKITYNSSQLATQSKITMTPPTETFNVSNNVNGKVVTRDLSSVISSLRSSGNLTLKGSTGAAGTKVTISKVELVDYISETEWQSYQADLAKELEDLRKAEIARLWSEKRQELYTEAYKNAFSTTSSFVTLQFKGTKDAQFITGNDANSKLYRIRAMKEGARGITITNYGELKAVAPTVGVVDYTNLPWSVSSGVLTLGEGINIESWGVIRGVSAKNSAYSISFGDYFNKSKGMPMYIPAGATLILSGANVNVGSVGTPTSDGYSVGAVALAGRLQVKTGSLILPDNSPGIVMVKQSLYGGGTSGSLPSLIVDGGEISTTRVVAYQGQAASLAVHGGQLNFNKPLLYTDNQDLNRTLFLTEGSSFTITGGEMNISRWLESGNNTESVNGIWLASAAGYNPISFNVTGGTINISGVNEGGKQFKIFGNGMKFYDINVTDGAFISFNKLNSNIYNVNTKFDNKLRLHNITLANNCKMDASWSRLEVSGNINFGSGVDVTPPDGDITTNMYEENRRILVFTGDENASINDQTGVRWTSVAVQKASSAAVSVASGALAVTRDLTGDFGYLNGRVDFYGTATQHITSNQIDALKGVNLHVYNTNGVELLTDSYLNGVAMEVNNLFNLGRFNLKLDTYPTKASSLNWTYDNMFYTDGSDGARGMTLPVPTAVSDNNIFPVGSDAEGTKLYSFVKPMYTSSATPLKYITVVPVWGVHPLIRKAPGVKIEFYYYWKIQSDVAQLAAGTNTYNCVVVDRNNKVCTVGNLTGQKKVAAIVNNELKEMGTKLEASSYLSQLFGGKDEYSLPCKTYTTGDIIVAGSITKAGGVYRSQFSGEWTATNMWKDETNNRFIDAKDISSDDMLVVQNGHKVTVKTRLDYTDKNNSVTKYFTAGLLTIEAGATFEVDRYDYAHNESIIEKMTLEQLEGDGTLQINVNSSNGSLYFDASKTEITKFYNSSTSTVIYNLSVDVPGDQMQNCPTPFMPNFEIKSADGSARSFMWPTKNNVNTHIYGNLTIGDNVTFGCSTYGNPGDFDVHGVVYNSGVFDLGKFGSVTRYYFRDDYVNQGTTTKTNNVQIFFYHNTKPLHTIENSGTINLDGCKVSFEGDKKTQIQGTATALGKTNLGEMHLNKSNGNVALTTTLPLGNASRLCNLFIEKGTFVHNCNSTNEIIYKGKDDFEIPHECAFELLKGKARIFIPKATDIYGSRVMLAGTLSLSPGTTLNVGTTVTSEYGGIGYVTGAKIVADAANVNLSYLCPFDGDGSIELTSSSVWTFKETKFTSQNFGVFDIHEGSIVNVTAGSIGIFGVCTNYDLFPTINYHPTQSTFDSKARIYFKFRLDQECKVNATAPLGYLSLQSGGVASMRVVDNPLTVSNLEIYGGKFYCDDNDLTILRNLMVNVQGGFNVGNNTVYFDNENIKQEIQSSLALELTFNNLVTRAVSLRSNKTDNDVHVKGELRVERGEFYTNSVAYVYGSAYVANGAVVTGNGGIHMTPYDESAPVPQSLINEGEISRLVIDNPAGIDAASQQSFPNTITKELLMKRGILMIGGNVLDIKADATIKCEGDPLGVDKMIMTNASYTDRGVRVHFKPNVAKTITVPIGQIGKYTPIYYEGLKASAVGSLIAYCNNGAHSSITSYGMSKYLNYYWSVTASENLKFTAGSVRMVDVLSDAIGYETSGVYADEDGKYMTAIINNGVFIKDNGTITNDASYITLKFDGNKIVSGVYTAGCQHHMPDNVLTYIALTNGNWSDAIWQKYDLKTGAIDSEIVAVDDKEGLGFVVRANVDLVNDSEGDNFLNIYFLTIDEGYTINFRKTQNNNVGTVTGKGTLKVESSNVPGGNFEEFFTEGGGILEYAGAEDYNIFVGIPYHNNVVLSGSGQRILPSGNAVICNGALTLKDAAQLVMRGQDMSVIGNMIYADGYTGSCTGNGRIVFAGSTPQVIESKADFTLPGIGIKNAKGLTINHNLAVNKLLLSNGVITMANETVLSLPDRTAVIESGSEYSFVDGYLARYAASGVSTKYYVGNKGRRGLTELTATDGGLWTVRYYNEGLTTAQVDQIKSNLPAVQSVGGEHWTVQGPSASATAKAKLRWDEQSGGFDSKTTKVLTSDGGTWQYVAYVDPSNNSTEGTLVTKNAYNGRKRIYVMTTSGQVSEFIWEGTISSDWNVKGNWNQNEVPSSTSEVIIGAKLYADSYDPVIESRVIEQFVDPDDPSQGTETVKSVALARAKSINIKPSGNLILKGAGSTLVVEGDVAIDAAGKFTIEYDVEANPNFILKGNQTGDIDVYRGVRTGRLYYMGSAVDNRTIKKPDPAVDGWGYEHLYLKECDYSSFKFVYSSTPAFDKKGNLAESLSTVGIITDNDGDTRKLYQRGVVASAKTFDVKSTEGARWCSNPYPFALVLNSTTIKPLASNTFESTLYARVMDGGWKYNTMNIFTGVSTSGLTALAPFQGFELTCIAKSQATVRINPNNRNNLETLQKSAMIGDMADPNEGKILRVFAGDKADADEVVFLMNEDGNYQSVAGDSKKKIYASTYTQISTNKGAEALVISHFPSATELSRQKVNLPLSVNKSAKSDELVIWIGNLPEFDFVGSVYLVDNLTGEQINLSEVGEYKCPRVDNLYEGRFELSFMSDVVIDENGGGISTGIVDAVANEGSVKIFAESDGKARITIFGEVDNNAQVFAYDVLGRVISSQKINNRVTKLDIPTNGVVVVKVLNGNVTESQKLLM